jgi:hypothetical protein
METATQPWSNTENLTEEAKQAAREGGKQINALTEKAASKTPSSLFIAGAVASIAISLFLQILGKKQWSQFVAHWVPSLVAFGLYNKMAKTVGAN